MATENPVSKHPLDNSFLRYIAAGFLAISLHMTFLLFLEASDVKTNIVVNVKHVTLLPLNTKMPLEKNLLEWMRIMDPTYVIKPDSKNGFNVTPAKTPVTDEEISLKKHFSQIKQGAFSPLTVPIERRSDKVKRFWKYTTAPTRLPSFYPLKHSEENYPLWVCENGTVLPQLFHQMKAIKVLLAKQKTALSETVLRRESRGSGFFPRIRIDLSCGNPELDRLAMKTLAIKGESLFNKNNENNSDPDFIAVKWCSR